MAKQRQPDRSPCRAGRRTLGRRPVLRGAGAIGLGAVLGVGREGSRSAAAQESQRVESPVELLVSGYDSPEGPAFDLDGNLFFVNWNTAAIVKLTPEGEATEFFNTGGIPAGLAFHPDGSLYVANEGEDIHGILRISPDGEAEIVVNDYEGMPLNGANDLVFDAEGMLYFSDPWGSSAQNPIGGFYRLFPDGTLERLDSGLAWPNGLALTPDGDAVILAETDRSRLLRYPIDRDGAVGEREVWALVDGVPGPDGMAFDERGNLYVAHFNAGHVDVYSPAGEKVDEIVVPGSQPTNVAFGGPDNRTLVITEVATASLYQIQLTVAGQTLHDGGSESNRS